MHAEAVGSAVEGQEGFRHRFGPDDRKAFEKGLPGGEAQHFARAREEDEAHFSMDERQPDKQFLRAFQFGGRGLEELEPGGYGSEEVAHLDHGSLVQAARPLLREHAVIHLDEGRFGRLVGGGLKGRFHAEARYRGDARQGFAPEAEGMNMPQIVHAGDLAGGVAGDGEFEFRRRDAAPVVAHADEALAAVFKRDLHQRGPGVETVFHKLLDHAGGPFHHLARRDLVAQFG